jgi:UDP-glucose 4-epimerase
VDRLLKEGNFVRVVDNLSAGSLENLKGHKGNPNFEFLQADLKNYASCAGAFEGIDAVFHFAANPEVRLSVQEPRVHFEENVLTTFNVLEACRKAGVKHFVFASSSTVYGDPEIIPTPEEHPLEPISIYGAAKLAGEEMAKTYAKLYGMKALILRYANIIGPRMAHGVIVDFIKKLKANPRELKILGDGTQAKSYLHVDEAVEATMHLFDRMDGVEVYNVGNEDRIGVREIADIIVKEMGLNDVRYRFKPATGDGRGWPGDVKQMLLDITKIKESGWKPQFNSRRAVIKTVRQLVEEVGIRRRKQLLRLSKPLT